ncbi:MAG: AtpZ/AtpI family protein [Acidobacteriota bacterium]|jgi:hypothetical protein
MPYHRPIPRSKQRPAPSGFFGAWVQAEKYIQIALVLPSAAFIGWLAGAWLDGVFHQTWITTAGIVLGIVAGLVGAIQLAMAYASGPNQNGKGENGKGDSGASS